MFASLARRRHVALIAMAFTLLLGGCPPPSEPVTHDVAIRGLAFSPRAITIQANDVVRWTNLDPLEHTVTSGQPNTPDAGAVFDSGLLQPSGTFQRQFTQAGTFVYFCRTHPTEPALVGATVIVRP
ncbi:MAG: plastocyanin/azurin family copper-binding protein [Planctomycetota bacterium]